MEMKNKEEIEKLLIKRIKKAINSKEYENWKNTSSQ